MIYGVLIYIYILKVCKYIYVYIYTYNLWLVNLPILAYPQKYGLMIKAYENPLVSLGKALMKPGYSWGAWYPREPSGVQRRKRRKYPYWFFTSFPRKLENTKRILKIHRYWYLC